MLFDSVESSSVRVTDDFHPQAGYDSSEDDQNQANAFQTQPVPIGHGAATHVTITPKVPPHYNGLTSWFNYEELIDDWIDITTLDEDKEDLRCETDWSVQLSLFGSIWIKIKKL